MRGDKGEGRERGCESYLYVGEGGREEGIIRRPSSSYPQFTLGEEEQGGAGRRKGLDGRVGRDSVVTCNNLWQSSSSLAILPAPVAL